MLKLITVLALWFIIAFVVVLLLAIAIACLWSWFKIAAIVVTTAVLLASATCGIFVAIKNKLP